ncbi:DivIVA domain-containing protein [Mycoplasmopsis bovis]|nr:DivIVA domain-containing protein [Mycoplasmopsis bovis]
MKTHKRLNDEFLIKKFSRELNGYSVTEVNSYINLLLDTINNLESEIKLLKNKQNEIASKHQNEITELESEISILRNESK